MWLTILIYVELAQTHPIKPAHLKGLIQSANKTVYSSLL